jgi:hypothetical protein
MSTNRSVGRITATQDEVRSASTQAKVRSTFKSKKDRSPNLCAFTFADGRQCRTPRCSGHLHLCYFHAQKEAESLAAQQVGEDISRFLPAKLLTACDLGVAMSRLFCAVAQGQIKPKVASTLAYLAQTMLQSIPIAQDEYIHSFDTATWRSAVRASFRFEDTGDSKHTEDTKDAPAPAPKTSPQPTASAPAPTAKPASSPAPQPPVNCHSEPTGTPASCHSERSEESAFSSSPVCHPERSEGSASSSNSSIATHHSPLPQPPQSEIPALSGPASSPHTPLPRTGAEFAQQVLASLNSSRSETPPQSAPARDPRSSGSPSSSTSPAPLQPPRDCHSERSEEPASSSNSSPATHHSPLPRPVPPPIPPGFGAPANWDVLIPPKPRRRFSRHWHLPE